MAEAWAQSPVLSGVITVLEVLGWVVAIGVWFFYKVRAEADKQEERLITRLQQRLDDLEASEKEYSAKIEKLMAENAVLKDLILGRDPEDKKYRDRALKAMAQIEAMYTHHLNENQGGK